LERGLPFPVPQNEFHWRFSEWAANHKDQLDQKVGIINNKLVYNGVTVTFEGYKNFNSTEQNAFYERLKNITEDFNSQVPVGVNKLYQTSEEHWAWNSTRDQFITFAY